jgi:uncharacterized tellurite resistance protein B-like protein
MLAGKFDINKFFFQISLLCCEDGKLSNNEIGLLKKVAQKLKIKKEKANQVINDAIKAYKSERLEELKDSSPDVLYRDLLIEVASDGVIDAEEDKILQTIKNILGADSSRFTQIEEKKCDAGLKLKPLKCIQCSGLLPFAPSEWIVCPYCGKKNNIPRTYVDAVAARKSFKKKHSDIQKFSETLGTAPSLFERTIAYFSDYLIFFIFILFVAFFHYILNVVTFFPLVSYYENVLGLSFNDFVPAEKMAIIKTLVMYIFLAIPFAFVYKARRKVLALAPLQFALAAKPPVVPGGPAICKNCGAGLRVSKNTHIVACDYCEVENLVGLPESWLKNSSKKIFTAHLNYAQALDNFKKESGRLIESLIYIGVIFVFYCFLLIFIYKENRSFKFLPLMPVKEQYKNQAYSELDANPRLKFNEWNLVSINYIKTEYDFADLYVAMDAKEQIGIEWKPEPVHFKEKQQKHYYLRSVAIPNKMQVEWFRTRAATVDGTSCSKKITDKTVKIGAKGVFAATVAGFYHLRIFFPKNQDQIYIKLTKTH